MQRVALVAAICAIPYVAAQQSVYGQCGVSLHQVIYIYHRANSKTTITGYWLDWRNDLRGRNNLPIL